MNSYHQYRRPAARTILLPVLLGAAAVLPAACGSSGSASTHTMSMPAKTATKAPQKSVVEKGKTVKVTIDNYDYSPAAITVKAGTKLVVTNKDQTPHTLTANDGAFDTGNIDPGQTKSVVVRKKGTFPYHCSFHAFMMGTVTVQ